MTLPINYKLPELDKDATPEEMNSYIQDLTFELQNMYEKTAQNVNGSFRSNDYVDGSEWIPTVKGATTAGNPSYYIQSGWAVRYGIITEVWFQIGWNSVGGASGVLLIDLPYKITKSDSNSGRPFVGPALSGGTSGLNYGAGRTAISIEGFPGTFTAKVESCGSGSPSHPVQISSNAYIAGSLRYIGVEDE